MTGMGKDEERPKLRRIPDQQPLHGSKITPDMAHNINYSIIQPEYPQVKPGEEIEPSKNVEWRAVGKPRRQTVGTLELGPMILKAQDPHRVDITVFANEATGQTEFERTSDVLPNFQLTGVLPTDFPERPITDAEATDPSDVSGPQLSTVRKQKDGASRKFTPVTNPGSRIADP